MILLDTHIWIWWVHGDKRLTNDYSELLQAHEATGLGVSVICICFKFQGKHKIRRNILTSVAKKQSLYFH